MKIILVLITDDDEAHWFKIPQDEIEPRLKRYNGTHIEGNNEYTEDRCFLYKHFGVGLGEDFKGHIEGEDELEAQVASAEKVKPKFGKYRVSGPIQFDTRDPVICIQLSSDN